MAWRLFWRYQWSIVREAGWPAVGRDSLAALAAGILAGGWERAMTDDWSWLEPVAAGAVVGLLGYAIELAVASYRLDALKERELSALRGHLTEDEVRQAQRDRKMLQRHAYEFRMLVGRIVRDVDGLENIGSVEGRALRDACDLIAHLAIQTDHGRGEVYYEVCQRLGEALDLLENRRFHGHRDFSQAYRDLKSLEEEDRSWAIRNRRFRGA